MPNGNGVYIAAVKGNCDVHHMNMHSCSPAPNCAFQQQGATQYCTKNTLSLDL